MSQEDHGQYKENNENARRQVSSWIARQAQEAPESDDGPSFTSVAAGESTEHSPPKHPQQHAFKSYGPIRVSGNAHPVIGDQYNWYIRNSGAATTNAVTGAAEGQPSLTVQVREGFAQIDARFREQKEQLDAKFREQKEQLEAWSASIDNLTASLSLQHPSLSARSAYFGATGNSQTNAVVLTSEPQGANHADCSERAGDLPIISENNAKSCDMEQLMVKASPSSSSNVQDVLVIENDSRDDLDKAPTTWWAELVEIDTSLVGGQYQGIDLETLMSEADDILLLVSARSPTTIRGNDSRFWRWHMYGTPWVLPTIGDAMHRKACLPYQQGYKDAMLEGMRLAVLYDYDHRPELDIAVLQRYVGNWQWDPWIMPTPVGDQNKLAVFRNLTLLNSNFSNFDISSIFDQDRKAEGTGGKLSQLGSPPHFRSLPTGSTEFALSECHNIPIKRKEYKVSGPRCQPPRRKSV